MDHWRRGHKQMCKKIHRGGNAEQYNADKKYKEAVAVAVEACAEDTRRYEEAKSFLGEQLPKARRALGPEARDVLKLRLNYAAALFSVEGASRDDVAESVTILEELESTVRRVYGPEYPFTKSLRSTLKHSRLKLAAFGPP